ncbi:peptide/nickel transport system permease protein [Halovenus aranensis]|jgi:peptide/nickel transport system permease protein|uniref:Peptide/nickel transport system permease protein n=1 Tax=Halovenus aranensis TaxID=890420 RepID=A0A1G8VMW9_9EURY|nr:ABC transporter permease [Halovenus aranensis]SDJ67322.1 peptide/nickel transport system permease protein [Halovenus aranensis]
MSRLRYFLRRLVLSIPVLYFGATLTFVIFRFGPIDPAAAIVGETATEASQAEYLRVREQLGLEQPVFEHYRKFMVDFFTFDLGQSWVLAPGTDVVDLLVIYGPRTMWIVLWAVLIPIFVGIPLGVYAGLHSNTFTDYLISMFGIIWRAMPNFWLAIILLAVLSQSDALLGFDWNSFLADTSVTGTPDLSNLTSVDGFIAATKKVLPAAVVLGSASMGSELRIARTAVLETINSSYVETAKANGVSRRSLVWKHILRNALVPLVPTITNEAFLLIGGSVIVEVVFGINGLGWLFFQSAQNGDLPLVTALVFVFIVVVVLMNIIQDLLYLLIDPRVGYGGR